MHPTNGILISGAASTNNTIQNNHIGTDDTGTLDRGNLQQGILVTGGASDNVIGGPIAGARNVIYGNDLAGVRIEGGTSTSNVLQGNYIGTDVTGMLAIKNTQQGIYLQNAYYTLIGTDGDGVDDAAEGNLISGNGLHAVNLSSGAFIKIAGNIIGLAQDGHTYLANQYGVGITS